MTNESDEDLGEIRMLADLLLGKEEGAFKIIRRRRMQLDAERRNIQRLADRARSDADITLTDLPVLFRYLNTLANQLARLGFEDDALIAEEQLQKGHLKTALARQIRLDPSDN